MAIESNGIKGNIMSGTENAKTILHRPAVSGTSSHAPNGALNEGQIIRGEITDLRNHKVTISLGNDKSITAAISDTSSLFIGQTATFKVMDSTPGSLILERLAGKYSDGQITTILKALEEAELPKNERNMQIVKDLLEYQMPINKLMLQQMIQQSASYSNISTNTLVLMNKYGIPVNESTSLQFENFREGNNSLVQTIDNVSNELPELLNTLANGAPANLVKQFGSSLTGIINAHINNITYSTFTTGLSFLSDEEIITLAGSLEDTFPALAKDIVNGSATINDLRAIIPENPFTENNTETQPAEITEDDASASPFSTIPEDISKKLVTASDYLTYNNHEIRGIMDSSGREALIDELKSLNISPELINKINDGSAHTEEVFSAISDMLNNAPDSVSDDIARLFSSDRFSTLFRHCLKNIWTLSPADIAKGSDSITEYYENLLKDLKETTLLINDNLAGQGSESLFRQTSSMHENIDFMEQLNSLFSYIQLPVKFQDQTIHSELYVYTKKDELKRHPGKVSVLLHLDMEHLGNIDIHIEKNSNQIDTVFYCSDSENAALFHENMSLLKNALNEKGYLFNANITDNSKKTDIVREFIATNTNNPSANTGSTITRYNFDIRA